jgi:Reverse transcriptase (RNA-dependent DNA polymerase)
VNIYLLVDIYLLVNIYIVLYADDIILIAPTVTGLQCLINVCESEIVKLDMRINVCKSMCIRFGSKFDKPCSELTSIHGDTFKWVDSCRYLGVHSVSGRTFKCSFDQVKSKFVRAFNAIYSKIGSTSSEETILNLLKAKCIPILLHSTEVCPLFSREKNS